MFGDQQFELGQHYTREEIAEVWGGSKYSGIEPSRSTDNVLLFSDPTKNANFGYHDNLYLDDGKPLAHYIGQGTVGDQQLTRRNRSLLDHRKNGKALRLFLADGKVPGTDTGLHKYLGEYELDPAKPCFPDKSRDESGDLRRVYVFQLRPVGEVVPAPFDYAAVEPGLNYQVDHEDGEDEVPPAQHTAEVVDLEKYSGKVAVRKAIEEIVIETRERDLVRRFRAWLQAKGIKSKRNKLPVPGESWLFTDLYEVEAKVLYEAKGDSGRVSIRMAIGQLFDYRRGMDPDTQLAVLLPAAPSNDLRDLIDSVGLALVYEENGDFVGWPLKSKRVLD